MRQRVAALCRRRVLRQPEQGTDGQTESLPRLGRQSASDDEWNATARADLIKQDFTLDGKLRDDLAVLQGLTGVRKQFHDVAHVHMGHIKFNRQRPRVLHRVVKDRRNLAAKADATKALVWNKGNVLAGKPQDGIGR